MKAISGRDPNVRGAIDTASGKERITMIRQSRFACCRNRVEIEMEKVYDVFSERSQPGLMPLVVGEFRK